MPTTPSQLIAPRSLSYFQFIGAEPPDRRGIGNRSINPSLVEAASPEVARFREYPQDVFDPLEHHREKGEGATPNCVILSVAENKARSAHQSPSNILIIEWQEVVP
jgi:hypothetical protein